MKKLLFFALLVLSGTLLNAQSVVFHERFDPPSNADSVIASGAANNWAINARLYASATQCDSNLVSVNDTAYLTTLPFSTSGNSFVYLKFSHICKIEILDAGEIEVSVNNGPWVKLTASEYIDPGNSQFVNQGNKFTSNAYPLDWYPASNAQKPEQSWWRNEMFNISALAGNSANVRVRFVLRDGNGNGANFNHGWYIDNLQVIASVSEITPPKITMKPPVLQDTITTTGPFDIYAWITDASGIDTAYIVYTVNNGSSLYVPMLWVSDSTYKGTIPSYTYTNRIDYHVHALDNSANHNANDGTFQWFYIKKPPQTITIGSGTLTSYYYGPIYRSSSTSSFDYSQYYYLITASELAAAGLPSGANITKLEWYKSDAFATNGNATMSIFMKNSTLTALTTGTLWSTLISGATQVYNTTTQTIPGSIGWVPFNISSFAYTGSALEIGTNWDCSMISGNPSTGAFNWQYTGSTAGTYTLGNANSVPITTALATGSYGGNLRPNVRISYQAASNQWDAGLTQITEPVGTVLTGSTLPIKAKLKNFGTDTLKTVTIKWALDGVYQDSINWVGSIAEAVVTFPFTVGNSAFPTGPHTIKAWTVKPNGHTDQNPANDTAYSSIYVCSSLLSGTYTVGGAGADFATLNDVMTGLNSCGVGGPTTFLINDGTYTNQLTFNPINGASATNTITFKPNTGANVTITNGASNSTIKFNGSDYIFFDGSNNGTNSQNMTITNTSTSASAVIWMVSSGNGAGCTNIAFKNCIITGASNASGYYGIAIGGSTFASNGADNDDILIENCSISKAYVGIWAQGTAAANPGVMDNFQLVGNNLGSSSSANYLGHDGIIFGNVTASNIEKNTVFNIITGNTTPVGITAGTGVTATKIVRNNMNNITYTGTGGYGGRGMYVNLNNASANVTIANNLIYKIGGDGYGSFSNSSPVGMYIDGTSGGLGIYYNSIYMSGNLTYNSATLTAAILFNSSSITAVDFRNNVFQNSMNNTANTGAKNYAIYSLAPGTSFTGINNNDYFASGTQGRLGYLVADITTIAAWRTATSQDAASMSVNPNFLSTTDLHTFSFDLNAHGSPVTTVTNDYDNNTRSATTPDIGAYEYDIPAKNLGIVALLSPQSSCVLTAAETVTIRLKNFGGATIDTAQLYYRINNGTPVSQQMIQTILPDSSYNFSFTQTCDLSVPMNYLFKCYLVVNGDTTHLNDTISVNVSGGIDLNTNVYTMGFESTDDMSLWTKVDVNADGSTWIFPTVGNARSGANSASLYTSASASNDWLFSRCFKLNAGTTYKIDFWYKAGSASYPQNLTLKVGNTNTPAAMTTTLLTLSSFTNITYQKGTANFTPTTTGSYTFGWWGSTTSTYSYAYIDDINISQVPAQEASLIDIPVPVSGCGLTTAEQVKIKIKNTGSAAITGNLTAYYKVNNGSTVTEPVTNTINVGDTLTFTFTQPADFHVVYNDSVFSLRSWISLVGDPFTFNDSLTKAVGSSHVPAAPIAISDTVAYGTPATLRAISPDSVFWYDVPAGGTSVGAGHIYVTPNLYTMTVYYVQATTPGGTTSWDFTSGLDGWTATSPCSSPVTWVWASDGGRGTAFAVDHPVNSSQLLTSPVINTNGTASMTLKYTHRFGTETGWDHGFVAYRLNGGAWVQFTPTVGAYTTSDGEYNEPLWNACATSANMPLYDGTMAYATHSGPINTAGSSTLQIAFVFTTDGSGAVDGWYLDNVTLDGGLGGCASARVPDTAYLSLYPYEASIVSMPTPADGCTPGTENVTIRIRNNGFNIISGNLTAKYTVNGSPVVSEPVTAPINPGDTLNFTFATPIIAGLTPLNQDSTYFITSYIELVGDLFPVNDTIHKMVDLLYTPPVPVVVNDTIPYGTTSTLHATAADSINWYDVATGGTPLANTSTFVTPILYNTTVYYAEAMAGSGVDSLFTINTGGNGCSGGNMFDLTSMGAGITVTGFDISPYASGVLPVNVYIKPGTYVGSETNAAAWTLVGTYNLNSPAANTFLYLDCDDFVVPAGQTIGVYLNFNATYTTLGAVTDYTNADLKVTAGVGLCGLFTSVNNPRGWNGQVFYKSGSGCTSPRVPDTVFVTGVPACDMSAQVMYSPNSGIELTDQELVTIRVKNFGSAPATSIPVNYQINGGTIVTETIAGPVLPNDTLLYTFTTVADLEAFGNYVITAFTSLSCDTTHTNDTVHKTITNNPLIYCNSTATSTADDDIVHVVFSNIDNVSPLPYTAMYTDYALTVPPALLVPGMSYPIDVTTGFSTTNTYSGYIEAYIDYNRNGLFEEPSEVVFGASYSGIQTVSGVVTVPFTAVTNLNTRMRIVCVEGGDAVSVTPCGTYTWGETEDYFVYVMSPIPHDAGVTQILQPVDPESEGALVPVVVEIQNYGTDTIKAVNNLHIAYILNGGTPVVTAWPGTALPPMMTDTVTLPNITIPAGMNDICAYTILAGDSNTFNDTICKSFYGNPQNDAGVTAILQPGAQSIEGATQTVTVIFKNFGSDTLFSTGLGYKVNGAIQASQAWTGVLLPGATDTLTFTQTFVVPSAAFTVCGYTSLVNDGDHTNDTTCINSYGLFTSTLPYYDNFDGAVVNWTQTDDGSGSVWQLGTPAYGTTNSAYTPPKAWDINLTTPYTNNAEVYLYTQNFDFSTAVSARMKFYLNYAVENSWDGTRIDYSIDTGQTWQVLGIMNDPNGVNWYNDDVLNSSSLPGWTNSSGGWKQSEYKLNILNNVPIVRFRFVFTTDGSGIVDGVSVDNFSITIPAPIDAGVELIKQPLVQAPAGSQHQVKVRIRNFGMDTLNSIPVSYQAGSLAAITETWNGMLLPDDTITYTFTQQLSIPSGSFILMSYTGVPADGDHLNDTTKVNFTGVPTFIVPYSDNFEGTVYFFGTGGANLWEWGVPASTTINTAHSPTHAWKTNIDGPYVDNCNEFLYTPYFLFSAVDSAYLEFWHWYSSEAGADGGNVQYSTNGGTTWVTLGYNGDPNGTNWYTHLISGTPCFSGSTTGWVFSKYNLSTVSQIINATGPVQFRFRFFANNNGVNMDGWAVDDFAISAPPIPNDAGVTAILQPSAPTQTGSNVTVQVTIKNFGTQTQTSIPVRYVVNGGAVTSETWTGTLAPGSTTNYTFTTPFVSPSSTYELCAFTQLTGDQYWFNDSTCTTVNTTPASHDVGVVAFVEPGVSTIAGDSIQVTVKIRNFGTSPETTFPLGYKRNGVQVAAETWNGTLNPGDTATYTFHTKYISPYGNYSLCAYTLMANDANNANNEFCIYPEGTIGIEDYDYQSFTLLQNTPNPATDNTLIVFFVPESSSVMFELTDILGHTMISRTIDATTGRNFIGVDASKLPVGVYFYSVQYKDQKLTKRMVVTK